MWKEGVVLEHEPDATLFRWAIDAFAEPYVIAQCDAAPSSHEARDDVERRRLARA